eukprot:gene24468-32919_t
MVLLFFVSFFIAINYINGFNAYIPKRLERFDRLIRISETDGGTQSDSFSSLVSTGKAFLNRLFPQSQQILEVPVAETKPLIDYTIYDADIKSAKNVLLEASATKTTEPLKVLESLSALEKLMRQKNRLDEGVTSKDTLFRLNGSWRLVFTTGTVNVQKKIGKVNYFPIKAVQSFNTTTTPFKITNGIYIGDFPLLKFFGDFTWATAARKLEFDFDEIAVVGLRFSLPKGGAAKIGSSTGLGAENKTRRPFFNWISADEQIATARGAGGGLALWKRVDDQQD